MKGILQTPGVRPRIELEPSSLERVLAMLTWIAVALNVLTLFYYWPQLPDRVPQHFDARGSVNAWGSPGWLLILPIMSLVLVVLFGWLTRFPHRYNFPWEITEENAERQYQLANQLMAGIRVCMAWVFASISWEVCRVAVGGQAMFSVAFVPLLMAMIFGPLVWYFVRAHQAR